MDKRRHIETARQAQQLAQELLQEMVLDGNDPTVIYSVFSIGSSICAHVNGLSKKKHLEGSDMFYEESSKFLKHAGLDK